MHPESSFQIAPIGSKSENGNDFTIIRHDVIVKFCSISLVKFSYWSKFHVNIITGSGVMTRDWLYLLLGIDQKSGNWKYSCLSFAQYLETEASKEYQIWHECI